MSSQASNRVGPDGVASTPSTYDLSVTLIANNVKNKSSNGNEYEYDITNLVAYFSVFERIESPGIDVQISIGDSVNLMEKLKLQGSETVYITVKRKEPNKQTVSHKLYLRIAEIFNYKRLKPGMSTYSLLCVTDHMYVNNMKVLDQSFTGSPLEVIKSITKSILTESLETSEGSKNIIKGVFPNIRPLQGIDWLLRQTFDESTPFFYYQTLKGNGQLHCKSYKSLLAEELYEEYTYIPFIASDVALETEEGYAYEKTNIRDISSEYNQGKYISAYQGAYASTLHTIDVASKEYKVSYNSYKGSEYKLNKFIPFSSTIRARHGGVAYNESPQSKAYFVSLNSKAFTDSNNYYSPAPNDLPKAMAYLENLQYQKHKIQIAGDFNLCVGKKVRIEVRKAQEEVEGSGVDKLQSGVYLVTELEHVFKEGYYQYLTIQKDSSEVDLDATE
jgi:hypothetical protein